MSQNLLNELRLKHREFVYESYSIKKDAGSLHFSFVFKLSPDITFQPSVSFTNAPEIDQRTLNLYAFHLGLIEMISYWKAACPQELIVRAAPLSQEQISWWHDLFMHGLGEFFYRNQIDFSASDFLNIESDCQQHSSSLTNRDLPKFNLEGDLILVGGGKDSSLTLELLKDSCSTKKQAFALNPIRAAEDSVQIAGYSKAISAKRTIDSKLLELNKNSYLNGHTPFSAYLAFLGSFAAVLHGYKNVIVSNENSANEENVTFHGMPINHQYSKTVRFEKLFRQYANRYLAPEVNYFSFLRPLNDLQISALFSGQTKQLASFRSCNVNQKKDSWCGSCPKCAFVYLSLCPFVSDEVLDNIFGTRLFENAQVIQHIRQLVGLSEHKPFECVGTQEESRVALALTLKKYAHNPARLLPALKKIAQDLGQERLPQEEQIAALMQSWNNEHCLPDGYAPLLKQALAKISMVA